MFISRPRDAYIHARDHNRRRPPEGMPCGAFRLRVIIGLSASRWRVHAPLVDVAWACSARNGIARVFLLRYSCFSSRAPAEWIFGITICKNLVEPPVNNQNNDYELAINNKTSASLNDILQFSARKMTKIGSFARAWKKKLLLTINIRKISSGYDSSYFFQQYFCREPFLLNSVS